MSRLTIRVLGVDPRASALRADAHALGVANVTGIDVADIIFFDAELSADQQADVTAAIVDPLLQHGTWDDSVGGPQTVETMLQPGVTDPVGDHAAAVAQELGFPVRAAAIGKRFDVHGAIGDAEMAALVGRLFVSNVVERSEQPTITNPFRIDTTAAHPVEIVAVRDVTDHGLDDLDHSRRLALDRAEMIALRDHFTAEGRDPTDVELETIAQTWSEHCSHKTFRGRIELDDGTSRPSLMSRLRDSTRTIDAEFVRSAFDGNAGIVSFEGGRTLALKAETHNHPSAIEPFGGANTGVGGVIRDILGAHHHPIACTDVLCFGPADLPADELPDGVLHPRLIRSGVVAGVADYGNKIGLPTVAGAVLYDPAFTANPLVFCGCIGVADDVAPPPGIRAGDRVVAIGGRTGRDGLKGATFSSAGMNATSGEVAGASVQIGDPITEKLVMDVLAEASGLLTAITDCGAGGFSSAIGELAEGHGVDVELASAPVKYPGLGAWEVWLSEAQERMVLAVDPQRLADLAAVCDRHAVEWCDLGEFTATNRLVVRWHGEPVVDLDLAFVHDGRPQRTMWATMPTPNRDLTTASRGDAGPLSEVLGDLLAHPDIASKANIIGRYDHEIRGATRVRPTTGVTFDGPSDGVVMVEPGEGSGYAIGIGVNPWLGLHDPYRMAVAVVDEAMRNVVAAGGDPDRTALLDNFSWGDPLRPSTMGELVAAVEGCCDAALAYGAPFVSGKDSLNNEYLGVDGRRHAVPPTLVITAVSHVPDATVAVTSEFKRPGHRVLVLGRTADEFAGSHLDMVRPDVHTDGVVPAPDPDAPARYRGLHRAIRAGLVHACHDISEGGLAVALAEMAHGGGLGATIDELPHDDHVVAWFAESTGRFVVAVDTADVDRFVALVPGPILDAGVVTEAPELVLPGSPPIPLVDIAVAWRSS